MSLQIEAVSVCIGYADFLNETAFHNRKFFNRWVIVTSPEDKATLSVCHRHNLDSIVTEDYARNGGAKHLDKVFNKGRAIQRGFDAIGAKDWVLHLDADVVLPPEFSHALEMAHLVENKIYGCDRQMVVGWDAWNAVKTSGYMQHGMHCYVLPYNKPWIGARWASPRNGYVPIGFFQLMHGSNLVRDGIWGKPYPAHHGDAARSDVQFGLQWDRRNRELIPELIVWHLESEHKTLGENWYGRTSKPFSDPHTKSMDAKTATTGGS